MAFTNFYVQTTGNNANAGTTTADAALVTQTNGSWDITADTFIATALTPFSATVVGEWASIYLDGATVAVYVAQVTTVNASGLSITLSTTAKYGTKPAAGATGRSCKTGGAWASELPLAAGGMASTSVPASTKVNIKAGTYTIVASRVISWVGLTTAPLWFSGYNTTPGDLDADTTNSLAKPVLALNSSFTLTGSGAHQTWSGLSVTGTRSGALFLLNSSTSQMMIRCRIENTSSNAAAVALQLPGNAVVLYTWCKVPTTATTTGVINVNSGTNRLVGVIAEGGGIAGFNVGGNTGILEDCIGLNNTGAGILSSTGVVMAKNCIIVNATVDGVKWSGTPAAGSSIVATVFSTMTNGINNASGTNTNIVKRSGNDYWSVTNREVGLGDSPEFFPQTESINPLVSATDLSLVLAAAARRTGFPGIFENQSFSSFLSAGAVDPAPGSPVSYPFAGFA